ncbi:unnamed protein product [Closterium sp. Yama58-4]|nr:unnamed protein product [Closterium sp. Yama58-4]
MPVAGAQGGAGGGAGAQGGAGEVQAHRGAQGEVQAHRGAQGEVQVPRAVHPRAVHPKAVQPKAVHPKAVHPKAVQPKAVHPKAVQPKAVHPKAVHPKAVHPKAVHPKAVHPKAVHPKAVHPKAVHPKAVHPKAVHPKAVHPKAVHPKAVHPKAVHPKAVHPKAVHPKAVHPKAVHPKAVHPKAVHPKAVHPKAVHPKAVHPNSVPGGGEGSSKPPTASPSTVSTAPVKRPRVGVTYKQQTLWGAPPPRNATSHKRPAPSADPKPPTALADAEYESVKKTFEGQWAGSFKWLPHTAYGAKGEGARDLQIGSIRTHTSSRAHKQSLENQEKAEAERAKQATITRWQTTDASTRHIIRLLHIAHFVCKADAPIAMFVDVTLVAHIVQQTRMRLKSRYSLRDPAHHFGSGDKMQLPEFIQRHGARDKREMKAEGVDGDGNPVTFEFTLHERPLPGHETDGDVTACVELSIKYVRAIDAELEWRMRELELLEGSKLFRTASYVSDDTKRLETFKKWLSQLHKLYHHKLPGKPCAAIAHVMMCVVATMSYMRVTNALIAYCCLLD